MRQFATLAQRVINRGVLGLIPDPDTWPEPAGIHALTTSRGIDRTTETFRGFILSPEFMESWPRRRTMIGAQAYRFVENGEYDCGWRLVDVAGRYLAAQDSGAYDIVTIVPTPPVFAPVQALEWASERIARRCDASFRPDLFAPTAPLAKHVDLLGKPPVPLADIYRLDRPGIVFGKRVLLCDWRWYKGRCMLTLAKLLTRAGAQVSGFTWLE